MATNTINLPKGFVLDKPTDINLPKGFVLDKKPETILAEPVSPEENVLVKPKPKGIYDFQRKIAITPERGERAIRRLHYGAQGIGGMVGGGLGAKVGRPLVGAGLGGAAAESLVQLGEHALTPGAAPQTSWEAGKKIGWAGGREMLEEGIARAVIKVGAPFAKKISPKTKGVIDYLKRYKGRLTPAQATEDRALDMLENVAESSILGGKRLFEFKGGQAELLDTISKDITERLGSRATKEQAGEIVQAMIKNKTDAFRKVGTGLYKKVDNASKGILINTKPLKIEAARMLSELTPKITKKTTQMTTTKVLDELGQPFVTPITKITKEALMPSLASKNTVRMLKDFRNLPDAVPFSYLNQWRSDLLQVGYAPSDIIPGKTAGMAKHFAHNIDNLFKQAEGGLTGEALQSLQTANSYWRLGKERFNSTLIKRIAKKNPEYVLPAFVKRGNIADIQEIRKLIGSEAWEDVKGAYIQDLLFAQAKDTSGVLSGKKLQNILTKMTPETMTEIFGKASAKELQLFANTAMAVQQRAAGGGGMLIQLTQAGAILSVPAWVAGGKPGIGAGMTATVLLGPYAMGHLFTNPTGIKWLTEGLITRKGTKEAIRLAPRIMQIISQEALSKDRTIQKERIASRMRQQRPSFGHHF